MAVPPTALSTLRTAIRKKRLAYSENNIFSCDADMLSLVKANVVGIYQPMGGEPDPRTISALIDPDVALPCLPANNSLLTFRRWSPTDPLVPAPWGGHQPAENSEEVVPDLIVVPLVAFDVDFNRVGQGGGHYDRYLAAHPSALRIGLAWDFQRITAIEPQPWDVPLDAVLTEKEFYVKDLNRCQRL